MPVSVALTGRVTGYAQVPEELSCSIFPGAEVTGSFSYDDEQYTAGALFFATTYGQPRELGIRLGIGGVSVATDRDADPYANALPYGTTTYAVQVLDDEPLGFDRIAVFSYGNSSLRPTAILAPAVQLFFPYPDGSGLDSASILELERAIRTGTLPAGTGLISTIGGAQGPFVFVPFGIDAIWIVAEPATGLLLCAALMALALRARPHTPPLRSPGSEPRLDRSPRSPTSEP